MAELHPPTPVTLVDWLDDLTVRFLLNLPSSELSSVPRLCFQVEEAQWYYEDFVRPAVAASGAPPLPSLPLRQFCLLLFQHCPLLSGFTDAQHIAAYEEFLAYKVRVPVRGAILLDQSMEKVVLVRGWKKGASWSFPRGKINKDEKDLDCAIREVYEETGYDVRQATLVPENEDEVKYIDITMREQHMRLFVFRDVPEDTYFEPKTRKEISKIQWYSIRDLPGFKKHKGGHEQVLDGEAVNANKFYMVAPFLGPLKKWINQQRKQDAVKMHTVMAGNGYAANTATEDEGDVEEEQTPEPAARVDQRSDELKKLLSIGGDAPAAVSPARQSQFNVDSQAGNLLAMLQGGSKPVNGRQIPQTPFDQINAFPPQPETPQPDHLRHPSISQQQHQRQPGPPQFPFSPQSLQQEQQQRNHSLPTPNVFGPGPGFPPHQQSGFLGMIPPHLLLQQQQHHQQFQQRQSMPGPMPPGLPFGQPPGLPFHDVSRPPMQPPQMPPPQMQHSFQQPPPNAFMVQGSQGAIGSGPSAPNASQLPPPRLNAQSMKLLDAFKSGSQQAKVSIGGATDEKQRPASTHQAALLDLFRKPLTSQSLAAIQSAAAEEPVSPVGLEATERPSARQERRPTLNEITRTLPMKPKLKSPEPPVQPAELLTQTTHPSQQPPREERSRSRQLFDPSNPKKFSPAAKTERQQQLQQPITILQPPPTSKRASRSPKPGRSSPSAPKDGAQNGHPAHPVSILARPGSSKGLKSPALPTSPLRNETPTTKPAFQPQVLKRPKATDDDAARLSSSAAAGSGADRVARGAGDAGADKKDQLLALFSKATPATPAVGHTGAAEKAGRAEGQQEDALSGLFNDGSSSTQHQQHQQGRQSPNPPPAPRIEPERRPSANKTTTTPQQQQQAGQQSRPQQQQQNLLLNLFTKPSSSGTPPITSPGTPISPFTLGTPATEIGGASRRDRIGSVASNASGSAGGTPVEAKEFLMGYLNGVVRNEGYRGAGAKR